MCWLEGPGHQRFHISSSCLVHITCIMWTNTLICILLIHNNFLNYSLIAGAWCDAIFGGLYYNFTLADINVITYYLTNYKQQQLKKCKLKFPPDMTHQPSIKSLTVWVQHFATSVSNHWLIFPSLLLSTNRNLYPKFASPWASAPCRPQDIGELLIYHSLIMSVPLECSWININRFLLYLLFQTSMFRLNT